MTRHANHKSRIQNSFQNREVMPTPLPGVHLQQQVLPGSQPELRQCALAADPFRDLAPDWIRSIQILTSLFHNNVEDYLLPVYS